MLTMTTSLPGTLRPGPPSGAGIPHEPRPRSVRRRRPIMQTTRAQSMRNAIAVMTAWSAQPDGPPDLLIDCLRQHLDTQPLEHALAAATELVMGMTSLCGMLLALNEEATGLDMEATLRELAIRYVED